MAADDGRSACIVERERETEREREREICILIKRLYVYTQGGSEPLPEALLWLLTTGEVPTESQVQGLIADMNKRAPLPVCLADTMHACVCMCAGYMYVYMHRFIYICTHVYIYTSTYMCICICIYIHIYIYIYIYIYVL